MSWGLRVWIGHNMIVYAWGERPHIVTSRCAWRIWHL